MKFPFFIAKRYVYSGSKNSAINTITWISGIGIVAGTMALFVVLSVFSGLKDFSLSFSNDFDPDLKAFVKTGKKITLNPETEKQLAQVPGIEYYSKIIEERALFTFNGKDQLAHIKGVDSVFYKVNQIEKTIFQGQWLEPETDQAVIGIGIGQKLSLGLFDLVNPFEVLVPKPGKGTIDSPNQAFTKLGLIPVGFYFSTDEMNQKYVFANLDLVQELLNYNTDEISGIEIKLKSDANEIEVVNQITQILDSKVTLKNRSQLNESLYRMLNTENLILYLIFTLVIAVTLFTLIGAIIMIIIEKKPNLKTLYNLGLPLNDLRKIFLFQGFLICFLGSVIGLLLGIVVTLLQQEFGFIMINQSMAYPVRFSLINVLIVMVTIAVLGFSSSWIASSRVNKKFIEN